MGFLSSLNKKLKRELDDARDFTTKKTSGGFDILKDIATSGVARSVGSKTMAALDASTKYGSRPVQGAVVSPFFDKERDANGNITRSNFNLRRGLSSYGKAGLKASVSPFGLPSQVGIGINSLLKDEEKSNNPFKQYSEARRRGEAFQSDPDVPRGLKVGADIGLDPTMYIPAGTIGGIAGRTGLASTKFGKVALGGAKYLDDAGRLKKASASSRSFRVGGGLIEGAGKYTPAIAAGSGVGAEIADRTPWKGDDYIAGLVGGMVGGIAGTRALDGSLSRNMIDDTEFERRVGELRKQTMSSDPEIASAAEEALGQLNELRSRGMIQPSKKISRSAKVDELEPDELLRQRRGIAENVKEIGEKYSSEHKQSGDFDHKQREYEQALGSYNENTYEIVRRASSDLYTGAKEAEGLDRFSVDVDGDSDGTYSLDLKMWDSAASKWESIETAFDLNFEDIQNNFIAQAFGRDIELTPQFIADIDNGVLFKPKTKTAIEDLLYRSEANPDSFGRIKNRIAENYQNYKKTVETRRESEGGRGFFGDYSSLVGSGNAKALKQGLDKNNQAIEALNRGDKQTAIRLFNESKALLQKGTSGSGSFLKNSIIQDKSGDVFRDISKHINEQEKLPYVAPGNQWRGILKSVGITEREMEQNGLDKEFFSQGKITRQAVLDRIREVDFDIEEIQLTEPKYPRSYQEGEVQKDAIHGHYTVPGGDKGTYREIIIRQKPNIDAGADPMSWRPDSSGGTKNVANNLQQAISILETPDNKYKIVYSPHGGERYMIYRNMDPENNFDTFNIQDWDLIKGFDSEEEAIDFAATGLVSGKTYNNQWDYPQAGDGENILATVRIHDLDGGRTVFINEFQSDWAQENRTGTRTHVTHKGTKSKTPITENWPHPFQNNWQELLIKRMLRYAADNGYDNVKFASGEETLKIPGMGLPEERIKRINGRDVLDSDGNPVMEYPAAGRRKVYNEVIPNKVRDIAKKLGLEVETVPKRVGKDWVIDDINPEELESLTVSVSKDMFESDFKKQIGFQNVILEFVEDWKTDREYTNETLQEYVNRLQVHIDDAKGTIHPYDNAERFMDFIERIGGKSVDRIDGSNTVVKLTPENRSTLTSKPQTMFSMVGEGDVPSDPNAAKRIARQERLAQMNVPAQKDSDSLNLPPNEAALGGDPRLAGEPNFPATRSENAGIDQAIEQGRVPMDPNIQERAAGALERTGQPYRDPRSVPLPSPKVAEKLRARYFSAAPVEPIENIPITEMPSLRQHLNELMWGKPDESGMESGAVRLQNRWAGKELDPASDATQYAVGGKVPTETARQKFTLNEFERPKAPPLGDYALRAEELLKTLSDEELDMPVANLEVADLIASLVGGKDMEKILVQRAEEAAAYREAMGNKEIIPNRGMPTFDIPPKSFDEQLTPDEEIAAIGAIHDQVVGGGNNGAPPPIDKGAGGAGGNGSNISFVNKGEMRNRLKYLADVRPLSEEAEAVKVWTKDNVIVKALAPVMNLVNPSVLINTRVGRLITARTRQELSINEMSQNVLSAFNRFNGFGGIRNAVGKNGTVFKTDDSGIVKGIGRHWNDVFADVESLKGQLTPQQYEYAKTFNDVIDDVRLLREIHMLTNLPREINGKLWVPRVVRGIDNIEIINPTNHKADRFWELATDGAKNGVDYANPLETVNLYLRETYNDILKQEFALEMKKITDPVESLVNPKLRKNVEIADAEFKSAKTELSFAAKQWSRDKENPELKRILAQAKARASETRIAQLKADFAMKEALDNLKLQETNRAYRVLEDGTKEPIATFNISNLGNRVVDREDAELLRNYIGMAGTGLGLKELNESFVAKAFGTAGRILRTTTSTVDVATPFIHNLPLMTENPKAFAKAMAHNYAALINPRVRDRYIFKNLKYINEMAAHGITVGSNEYFEALGKNSDFTRLFDKTLGKKGKTRGAVRETGRQTIGRFEAAMSTNLLVGRTELWKANRERYFNENNIDGLAKFVRNISGALDSRALMVSKSQRDWESFWLAFSPKLVRSTFALGAMAIRIDTQEGKHAARSLGVFMGTAMGLFYLSNLAYQHANGNPIDPLSEEARWPINPTAGKKFLSTETPIGYLGVGGQWRAAAQLLGNSATTLWHREPGNFIKMDQFDNPIANWYMGRGAPGIQFGQDIVEATTGANANPYAEIGGPGDLFKAQAQNFLPFFAQNLLEAEDMKSGALQAGIGSFGPRYSPFSEAERRDMRVQKMGFLKDDGTPAEKITDLNREQKSQYYEKFPVSKITSKDNVTKMFSQIDDAELRFNSEVAEMSLNVQAGRMSKIEFREWYQKRNTEKFAQIGQIKNDFSVMPADRGGFSGSVTEYIASKNTRPEDRAVDAYYAISSSVPLKDDGTVDFEGINKARAELLRDLPPNQRQYVERMTNKGSQISDNTIVQEYDIIKEVTKDYWESDTRAFEYFKQNSGFFAQFNNYEAYQKWEQKTAMEYGITPETLGSFLSKNIPDVKKFNTVKSEYKKLQRLQNPYLDRALVEWYGMEPANRYDYILSGYGSDAGAAMAPAIYNDSSLNSANRTTKLALQLRQGNAPRNYTSRKFYRPQRSLQ